MSSTKIKEDHIFSNVSTFYVKVGLLSEDQIKNCVESFLRDVSDRLIEAQKNAKEGIANEDDNILLNFADEIRSVKYIINNVYNKEGKRFDPPHSWIWFSSPAVYWLAFKSESVSGNHIYYNPSHSLSGDIRISYLKKDSTNLKEPNRNEIKAEIEEKIREEIEKRKNSPIKMSKGWADEDEYDYFINDDGTIDEDEKKEFVESETDKIFKERSDKYFSNTHNKVYAEGLVPSLSEQGVKLSGEQIKLNFEIRSKFELKKNPDFDITQIKPEEYGTLCVERAFLKNEHFTNKSNIYWTFPIGISQPWITTSLIKSYLNDFSSDKTEHRRKTEGKYENFTYPKVTEILDPRDRNNKVRIMFIEYSTIYDAVFAEYMTRKFTVTNPKKPSEKAEIILNPFLGKEQLTHLKPKKEHPGKKTESVWDRTKYAIPEDSFIKRSVPQPPKEILKVETVKKTVLPVKEEKKIKFELKHLIVPPSSKSNWTPYYDLIKKNEEVKNEEVKNEDKDEGFVTTKKRSKKFETGKSKVGKSEGVKISKRFEMLESEDED